MSQRTLAAVLAVPLVLALWLAALFAPLPYVTYSPGITVDVLASDDGQPRIEVTGAKTYPDDGSLVMTTVYVTRADRRVNIFEVMASWFDKDEAVYPYDAVYSKGETAESSREESARQMASSQDVATAVALDRLGYDVGEVVAVLDVTDGAPADGVLQKDDRIISVDGVDATSADVVIAQVDKAEPDVPLPIVVERDGKQVELKVTPTTMDGKQRIGAMLGRDLDLPLEVQLRVNPSIGGPSAGLIFALGVYDTLTPGALTEGGKIAGTGTLSLDGAVGAIGGIQQKIAASRELGAEIFLVPAGNCDEALGARAGDMRLVKVQNFDDALASVQSWGEDHDVALPTCERNSSK